MANLQAPSETKPAEPVTTFAEWRPVPSATISLVQALRWAIKNPRWASGIFAPLVLVGLCAFFHFHYGWRWFMAGTLLPQLPMAIIYARASLRRVARTIVPLEVASAMGDRIEGGDQVLALAYVRRKFGLTSRLIGSDFGIITVSDDLLHFEGRSTAFDLPLNLARINRRLRYSNGTINFLEGMSKDYIESFVQFSIPWRDEFSEGRLILVPYISDRKSPAFDREKLSYLLSKWYRSTASVHNRLALPPKDRRARDV